MIYVDRPPEPDAVRDALSKPHRESGQTELELARAYYAQIPSPTRAFDFDRYRDWDVCLALDELFHEKCAYCESKYCAVSARNIDHYRPKGDVLRAEGHRGYWWLAAVWHNLLPSCPGCNQLRKHTMFEPGMTAQDVERARRQKPDRVSGKGNHFPLRSGKRAMQEIDSIDSEDPLLLNPCERDPQNHFEFVFDRRAEGPIWIADPIYALVRPKKVDGEEDCYANASIAILGLNRAELIRARAERISLLQRACQPIIDLVQDLMDPQSAAQLAKVRDRLTRYRADLNRYRKPKEPYAAMANAFIKEFEQELVGTAVKPVSTPV